MPDEFLRGVVGADLPPAGQYGVAVCFLPQEEERRHDLERLLTETVEAEGQRVVTWRDIPVEKDYVGITANWFAPYVKHLVVAAEGPLASDPDAFERKLYVIRRVAEIAAGPELVIPSFSSRTIVYKGMLTSPQVLGYFPDLADPRTKSALALVHSRFSTNTLGSWDLAHPFHYLAHNGEINTVRGNRQWMHAREPQLRSAQLGDDLPKLFPLIDDRWSDSAALDAAFELLVLAGRAPAHALAMLIPAAWSQATPMADDLRAFYEFHAGMLEPWDGPAAIAFCDGRQAGATLDRNGLRPCRYQVTRDGLLVLASEAGVLELDPAEVVVNDRLKPGQMLIVDTDAGRIRGDDEIKRALARRRPYRALLDEQKIYLEDIPSPPVEPPAPDALERDLRLFGYTAEEVRDIIAPMARDGQEPIASMGVDTPLAALSQRPRLLRGFFKQLFAQVTNPAIDPQRETLVMSLRTAVGAQGNLLDESPDHARRLAMAQPVLTSGDLAKLRALPRDRFRTITLDCTFDARGGGRALERALDALCRRASRAIALGEEILVLSDRSSGGPEFAPIPALLATAAVHSHLVREGWRTKCGLIVESGEPREVMDFALLVGFGAAAVNPYVALDLVAAQWASGDVTAESAEAAQARYVQAVGKGLLKVLSKMGVSTVMSYRGAQLFECVGLSADVVARYFTGTPSRVGGIGLEGIASDTRRRQEAALAGGELDPGGVYAYRLRGERHVWNPEVISHLQRAVRDERPESYRAFSAAADEENRLGGALRGLMELVPAAEPLPLDEVEPSSEIVRRFASGAMSLGSISKEAHETLAIALNRLGGRSNSGEGGEDARRSLLDANGDSRRSAIKQVASARFGVTTAYLVDADVLQIKVSQGAKPGEGGQLPGHKVDVEIARLRHSTPGVGLISPPPHHDIYSIEDLAQLIHDLRCANPTAEISVKLVALAGVGTVAAGVAKAGADHIVIAGMDGGTGASPTSSIRHAGVPWELGLAETQQVLVGNDLRGRVRLQVDGGLRTGFDVVVGALLGAEEFGFSTAPLVAAGCIMMRVCHLNTCPVGIATQDPELRRRFAGTPEHVLQYMLFVAEEVRELMAQIGVRRFDDLIGRTDLARQVSDGGAGIDLAALLAMAAGPEGALIRFGGVPGTAPAAPLDREILSLAGDALARGEQITVERAVHNTDRAIGTLLSGEIVRRLGPDALADGALTLRLAGTAGQSLGAWGVRGLVLDLQGQANDYVGKGLSGARIVVRPPAGAGYEPTSSIAVGNTTLYGATSGELFVRGRAGERFAVRNSGATAVVEGVGRHGCEYMTGGLVAVLGPVGRNFAAGMSGGIAYLWDPDGENARRVNSDMVLLRAVSDDGPLRELLERHRELTDSDVAAALLADWDTSMAQFVEVMPHDLLRIAAERDPELEGARG